MLAFFAVYSSSVWLKISIETQERLVIAAAIGTQYITNLWAGMMVGWLA